MPTEMFNEAEAFEALEYLVSTGVLDRRGTGGDSEVNLSDSFRKTMLSVSKEVEWGESYDENVGVLLVTSLVNHYDCVVGKKINKKRLTICTNLLLPLVSEAAIKLMVGRNEAEAGRI